MKEKSMKKLLLVCLLAVIGTGAFGTVFPRGDGLDIADPATWGLVDTIPTDLLVYQNANAPSTVTKKWYTASKDIAVGGIYCDYGTLELNLPADRTITMNGDLFCYNGPFVLTGGIYDFKNTSAFRTGTWSQYVYPGLKLDFDGCVLTNLPSVYLQNNAAAGGKWMLKNGAGFHVNGWLCLAAYKTFGPGLTLSLASGSKVVCRYFRTDDGQEASDTASHFTGATLSLTGAGTSFIGDMTGVSGEYHKLGNKHAGAHVIVDDYANLQLNGGVQIGTEALSISNELSVLNHATATVGNLYLGWNGGGGHTVRIQNEATLTASASIALNGVNASVKGNVFIVSNGTVNAQCLHSTHNRGSGTTLRLSGDHPQIRVNAGTALDNANAFELNRSVTLAFDIPKTGYVDDQIPIIITGSVTKGGKTLGMGTYCSDDTLKIELNGVEDYKEYLDSIDVWKKTVVLLKCPGSIDYSQTTYDAANAQLPERCRLFSRAAEDGGDELCLEVKNRRGLFLVVQ